MNLTKELRAARLIAKRYEDRGYIVTIEPPSSAIPFELVNYRPDILAIRGDEHLIIDIKTAGTRGDPEAYFRLDEQMQQHPGWRLLLVTVTEAELDESVSGATNYSVESIRTRLQSIDRLGDDPEIATLVLPPLWTAFIAALQLLLANEGIVANGHTDLSLLNKAYSEGLLSFEEHEAGRRLMALRNRTVHSLDILDTSAERGQLRQMIESILYRVAPLPTAAVQK